MIIKDIKYNSNKNIFIITFNDNSNLNSSNYLYNELNLSIGKKITENEFLILTEFNEYDLLKSKILNFLSYRIRTEKEIRERLLKETNDEIIIEEILFFLKNNNYVNDKNFIKKYYNEKSHINKWSSKKIIFELYLKGITKEDFHEVIPDTYEKDYDNAQILVNKKFEHWKEKFDNHKLKNKIYNFLSKKGFSYDIISNIIEELML